MGRWAPGARSRLWQAALELYADPGFDETTVADIAARAGVTERTFFRHFSDKREVLFDGAEVLQNGVSDGIAAAPPDESPLVTMGAVMERVAAELQERRADFARQRAAVIAANPSLQEREVAKMANLAQVATEALRQRGVPDPDAALIAETGITLFSVGFERWIRDPEHGDFASFVREARERLQVLVGGAQRTN
jgi:AcrR family transcriptional regulator